MILNFIISNRSGPVCKNLIGIYLVSQKLPQILQVAIIFIWIHLFKVAFIETQLAVANSCQYPIFFIDKLYKKICFWLTT
jgi:hypothetical protein